MEPPSVPSTNGTVAVEAKTTTTTTTTTTSITTTTTTNSAVAVESLIDDFKVFDILDSPSVNPSFTLKELSTELPRMLEQTDKKRLKMLLNIFDKVPIAWLFPDDSCEEFVMILNQLFRPLISIDGKVQTKVERKEKCGDKAGQKRKVILVHLNFDFINDVFSLILSLLCRVLRYEEDANGTEQVNKENDAPKKDDSRSGTNWFFVSGNDLSIKVVRELSLQFIAALSIYSTPHPWTNEALNSAAQELRDALLCLNRNASLSEFIVGLPGESEGSAERLVNGETGKGGAASQKRKPLGLSTSNDNSWAEANEEEIDPDSTLCEETTIIVTPSEITKTTASRKTSSSSNRKAEADANSSPLYRKSHLESFLRLLEPHLVKEVLAARPVMKQSFLWLVETVEARRLEGAEQRLFPAALVLIDSLEKDDKVVGLKCLTEIVQKIPPASVLDQNIHLVLTKVLSSQMMMNSIRVVQALHPCVIAFLETHHLVTRDRKNKLLPELIHPADNEGQSSSGPSAEDLDNPDTPRNQLFQQLLFQFEIGGDLNIRRENLKCFGAHIRGMGIALCRYLKRTINFINENLCLYMGNDQWDPEETTRLLCLDALCDVIRATKPRMHAHVGRISTAVVKVMLDVTRPNNLKSQFARDNVLEKCKGVLILLGSAAPREMSKSLKAVPVSIIDEKVSKVIKAVGETLTDDKC